MFVFQRSIWPVIAGFGTAFAVLALSLWLDRGPAATSTTTAVAAETTVPVHTSQPPEIADISLPNRRVAWK